MHRFSHGSTPDNLRRLSDVLRLRTTYAGKVLKAGAKAINRAGRTHDGFNHVGKTYGIISSTTKRALHKAERRTAAQQITDGIKEASMHNLDSYTGIFQTKDELQARRVLGSVTYNGQRPGFIYKDGWYSVVFPGLLPEAQSAALNATAIALAFTDIKPLPLSNFQQLEHP